MSKKLCELLKTMIFHKLWHMHTIVFTSGIL